MPYGLTLTEHCIGLVKKEKGNFLTFCRKVGIVRKNLFDDFLTLTVPHRFGLTYFDLHDVAPGSQCQLLSHFRLPRARGSIKKSRNTIGQTTLRSEERSVGNVCMTM